jgi:hypothetical protein
MTASDRSPETAKEFGPAQGDCACEESYELAQREGLVLATGGKTMKTYQKSYVDDAGFERRYDCHAHDEDETVECGYCGAIVPGCEVRDGLVVKLSVRERVKVVTGESS